MTSLHFKLPEFNIELPLGDTMIVTVAVSEFSVMEGT
jgi:hypothetical protein